MDDDVREEIEALEREQAEAEEELLDWEIGEGLAHPDHPPDAGLGYWAERDRQRAEERAGRVRRRLGVTHEWMRLHGRPGAVRACRWCATVEHEGNENDVCPKRQP